MFFPSIGSPYRISSASTINICIPVCCAQQFLLLLPHLGLRMGSRNNGWREGKSIVLNSRAPGTLLLAGGSIGNVNVRGGIIWPPLFGRAQFGIFGARNWAP